MKSNRTEVLIVGSVDEDEATWRHLLEPCPGTAHRVPGCREALSFLHGHLVPVVICERDLPDGSWRDVLEPLAARGDPPAVIVTSRLADDHLWLEVLNAGGYDVWSKPLDRQEARRTLVQARHHATLLGRAARAGGTV
jgi:CheY-like chemotaxis protein